MKKWMLVAALVAVTVPLMAQQGRGGGGGSQGTLGPVDALGQRVRRPALADGSRAPAAGWDGGPERAMGGRGVG